MVATAQAQDDRVQAQAKDLRGAEMRLFRILRHPIRWAMDLRTPDAVR